MNAPIALLRKAERSHRCRRIRFPAGGGKARPASGNPKAVPAAAEPHGRLGWL